MARLNIEEKLFKDLRFQDLIFKVGCRYTAIGLLTSVWILAQQHWLKSKAIPAKAWRKEFDPLIEIELAKKLENGDVYVKGSKTAFKWLEQKSEAGKKGGRPISEKPPNEIKRTTRKASVKRGKAGESGGKPPTLSSLLFPPSLSSNSSSSTVSVSTIHSEKDLKRGKAGESGGSVPTEHSKKAQLFVGAYCQLFKSRYGMNPKILGKDAGIAGRLSKQLSEEDIKKLLSAFFSMPDAWLVKAKHPLSAFEMKLNEVVVYANSGNFTTQTQANQADAFATNAVLLNQVRRGEA